MTRIVFLDAGSMGDTDLAPLQLPGCHFTGFASTTPAQVISRLQAADIAIVNKVALSGEILKALPQLKLICVGATGVNNIDLAAAATCGITVSNVRGYADTAVPQHAIALLLGLTNQISNYQHTLASGEWSQSPHFCLHSHRLTELAGRTFVVMGYGALGQATGRLAAAFGMQVVVSERPGIQQCRQGRVQFEQALRQADILSLHCPLTEDTYRLLNAERLALLPDNAIIINTARGDLIDETALYNELKAGRLAAGWMYLALNLPAPGHILLQQRLPNLLITPHVGWASPAARSRLLMQLCDNISAFLAGKPLRQL